MTVTRCFSRGMMLLVLCSGCSRSSPAERAQGTYVYQRPNGTARVALQKGERYHMVFQLGSRQRSIQGTYALRADTITLTNAGGGQIQGLASDTALLLYLGGQDLTPFRRQSASLDSAGPSD